MLSRFLPKSEPYFSRLAEMAARVQAGGELFEKLFHDFKNRHDYADRIKAVEVECDRLGDAILEKLNTTFITPIDREDIHALVQELDDVIDLINGLARRLDMYGVKKIHPQAAKLACILTRCTVEMAGAFSHLEKKQDVSGQVRTIDRLEKEADQLYQEAIRELFQKEKNPIEVVRWSAIFDALEDAVDRCKTLGGTLTAVVVKNK